MKPSEKIFSKTAIEEIRAQIDVIDHHIISLIEQREQCVRQLANIKRTLSKNPVYYDPAREKEIIERVKKIYKGSLPAQVIEEIFKTLILHCRLMQERHDGRA